MASWFIEMVVCVVSGIAVAVFAYSIGRDTGKIDAYLDMISDVNMRLDELAKTECGDVK